MNYSENNDLEFDITSYIYNILKHWRFIILSMLLVGVLFNIYAYYKTKKDAQEIQQKLEEYEEISVFPASNNTTLITLSEFEENLTPRQISEVNNLVSTYKMFQQPYADTVDYINNSILMQLDPKSTPTYTIQYLIDTHYVVEYPVIEKNDQCKNIIDSVSNILLTQKTLNTISDSISTEDSIIEAAYIKELIRINSSNNLINISIYGRTENECKTIAQILKNNMPSSLNSLKKIYGDFDYVLVSENYSCNISDNILEMQQEKANNLTIIYNTTQNMLKNLTDEQKSYFYALISNENTISVELPVETKASDETTDYSELVVPTIKTFYIKYIIVGLIAGFILACGILYVLILLKGNLISASEIESKYNVPLLGIWRASAKKKKLFNFIDNLLIKMFDAKNEYSDPEKSLNRIITDITLSANLNNWEKLNLITSSDNTELQEQIVQINNKLKGTFTNIQTNNVLDGETESLNSLNKSEAVVIIEQINKSKLKNIKRVYSLCHRYQKPIIGYIIIK
ncbi:MAG: hypothetical protein K6E10_05745 [Eubacterium sp.]|nr:hypothetical protein [Eubacterium sp.]